MGEASTRRPLCIPRWIDIGPETFTAFLSVALTVIVPHALGSTIDIRSWAVLAHRGESLLQEVVIHQIRCAIEVDHLLATAAIIAGGQNIGVKHATLPLLPVDRTIAEPDTSGTEARDVM